MLRVLRGAKRRVALLLRRAVYRCVFGRFKYLGPDVRIDLRARIERPENISIGSGTEICEFAHLRATPKGHISIGRDCYVGRLSALIDAGGSIEIEDRVQLGGFCVITGQGGVRIGEAALFAPSVSVIANQHTFGDLETPIRDQPETSVGVTIGRDGWIGTGAVILDGVTVGDHVVIGANAVVTKDVPSFSIAVGIPAKVLRTIE